MVAICRCVYLGTLKLVLYAISGHGIARPAKLPTKVAAKRMHDAGITPCLAVEVPEKTSIAVENRRALVVFIGNESRVVFI